MQKIILATLGLAMFATPLAAGNPHSDGYAAHEFDPYAVEQNAPAAHASARSSQHFFLAPTAGEVSGLGTDSSISGPRGGHWDPHQGTRLNH